MAKKKAHAPEPDAMSVLNPKVFQYLLELHLTTLEHLKELVLSTGGGEAKSEKIAEQIKTTRALLDK